MAATSRRGFLTATGATLGGLIVAPDLVRAAPEQDYRVVTIDSEQYQDLCQGTNLRWIGNPARIAFPRNADEIYREIEVIQKSGFVPAIRSGGHCYEAFVANERVTAIVDLSSINQVTWDPEIGAFEVGAGAQLGAVYQLMYKQWGVYIPAGNCPTVAAGGHIAGGGYGCQNRRNGLVVDHLHAVEVVYVAGDGSVQIARGTRNPDDPHHDLWWAYTGGGGGNFGVVVRYWLRSPNSDGSRPETALPRPPRHVWVNTVSWKWDAMTEASFTRLMNNHGKWHEENSDPGSRGANLFSQLKTWHRSNGSITMDTIVDADIDGAEQLCLDYIKSVGIGVGSPTVVQHRLVPWMQSTQWAGFTGPDPTRRFDGKSAYLRRNWTAEMISAAYRGLNDPSLSGSAALLMIASFGGAVNRVAPDATAVPQRDSIIKFQVVSIWDNPQQDDANIAWTRKTYGEMFASTGGVPVPNEITDGAFVNYADMDLDDPRFNTSNLTSADLYYKGNLDRLKKIRARYDPKEFFRHAQSISIR